MLAVIGPLFAGLHSLILEAAPPVETPVLISDMASPTPDVVVVETVVERVVYVPIDSLPGSASAEPTVAAGSQPPMPVAGGGPADDVSKDRTEADDVAAEAEPAETEQAASAVPPALPRVSPPVWIPPQGRAAPVADEPEEIAEEASGPEESDQVAEASADPADTSEDEHPVAEEPRVIVVHTLTWDGEQFSAAPGEPVEHHMIAGTREEVAELPPTTPDAEPEAAAVPPSNGAARSEEGEPEGHQVADGEAAVVAERESAAEGDTPTDAVVSEGSDDVVASEEGPAAQEVAEGDTPEAEHLIVKADEAESPESDPSQAIAEGESVGDSQPVADAEQQARETAAAEVEAAADETETAVANQPASDEAVAAVDEGEPTVQMDTDVEAAGAEPEAEAEEIGAAAEPEGTPTVSRHPAGESADIVLP
jgi:trimeric autotransporter adhesin